MPTGTAEDSEALGFAAFDAGAHHLSRDWYEKVVAASPRDPLAWYNLATGERNIGNLDAAEAACDRALSLDPDMAQTALIRSQLRSQTAHRNHIDDLRAMLDRATRSTGANILLHYALGKEYDDLGEFDAAFDNFAKGAQARRKTLDYAVDDDVTKLARIIERFDASRLAHAPATTLPAYGFIIGLPRSGTTMIERILTGSDRVRSNGETDNLFGSLAEGAATTGQDVFERVATADPVKVQQAYARRAGTPEPRSVILEKLPFNYLYAGAIRLTMPSARTLLVTRAPIDNCFAMFSTLFGSAYPFSYSLEELAVYFIAYRKLMTHWRELVGEQLLDVAYENVVNAPEANGRRVAEHMGVRWDDQMVHIENNKSASATASAAQIRRPIYRSAAGRAQNYARHLHPLVDELARAGIDPFTAG